MKFKHIEELESLYVTKGNDSTDEDIEEFKKFIWRQAEIRGLIINAKEGDSEDRNVE
jgi:erythromycin esterase-like protein|tara:strand:- start:2018 stop:2188 length:171 start_codon:yes stop_codon:yes gene_type:complete